MWIYEKKLQFPVKIKTPNAKLAQVIISQLGGPDGELAASMRYLHQRYACPYNEVTGILTDVGTEELAHLEMIAAILHQLTRDLTFGIDFEERGKLRNPGTYRKRQALCANLIRFPQIQILPRPPRQINRACRALVQNGSDQKGVPERIFVVNCIDARIVLPSQNEMSHNGHSRCTCLLTKLRNIRCQMLV